MLISMQIMARADYPSLQCTIAKDSNSSKKMSLRSPGNCDVIRLGTSDLMAIITIVIVIVMSLIFTLENIFAFEVLLYFSKLYKNIRNAVVTMQSMVVTQQSKDKSAT